jgi:glycosyltransferase involved in cell wall biosynthesis
MHKEPFKASVIILGKIPPPFYGPAIATEIILKSSLSKEYNLIHIDTRLNSSIGTMGKLSFRKVILSFYIYKKFAKSLVNSDVKLVLLPIAQETSALLKDAVFVLLSRMFRKAVILHLRGSALLKWYNARSFLTKVFFKRIFLISSGAIVLGDNLKYIFESFFPADKIFVVPNGGNYDFPPRISQKSGISVLYLSNLVPGKGIEDVLHAVDRLPVSDKNKIMLEVVGHWGDPDFELKCHSFTISLNLPVRFHKEKSGKDKLQFFADADIFIFPPRTPEGHPWVIVEALAAGLPIISTNQGAIVESVRDGINGYIIEPQNPDQISNRLSILINNSDLRQKMSMESHRLYIENFTESKMIEKLSGVFHNIIRGD